MSTALMTSAVIPWGDKLHLFGRDIILQATDIDVVAAGAGRVVGVAWARPVQHENIIDVPAAHHEIVIAVHPDYHG